MEIKQDEILQEFSFKVPGIYEIRIIINDKWNTTLSAYVDGSNIEDVLKQIEAYQVDEDVNFNVYMTVNPCRKYCEAREQYGKLKRSRITTQDDDVEALTWLPIDIDPPHPAGTSASDEEKKQALVMTEELVNYMALKGWNVPEIMDSGNGYHIKYRIYLPNDDNGRELVANMLENLSEIFPLVDVTTKNPSRILTVPGSLKMKGRSIEDRPHRWARIMDKPSQTIGD